MLRARDVSFAYRRSGTRVIDAVSIDIARGAIVGLLGPNGSGKSTLLRLLAGMLTPLAGTVTLDDRNLRDYPRRELARRIAVVPQDTHTTFDFTVIDMVLMGRYPHLGAFELEGDRDLDIARAALAATGTAGLESRAFSTLSGGEKQRVVIAAAVAQSTDLMLLDEPTAALDLGYQLEVAALLRRLNTGQGATLVVSTHDLNVASALCDEVVLLKQGAVLAAGATAATLTPANIRALYDVDADVQFHSGAGRLTVVPLRRVR